MKENKENVEKNIEKRHGYSEYVEGIKARFTGDEFSNPVARVIINWKVTTWEEFERNFPPSDPFQAMAMLHHGFDLETHYDATGKSRDEEMERIIFYLRTAYQHHNVGVFKVEDEEFVGATTQQIEHRKLWHLSKAYARQAIAKKAFEVLATRVSALGAEYKNVDDPGRLGRYTHYRPLVEALLAFFSPSGYPQNAFLLPNNLTAAEERHAESMKEFYARYMQVFIMSKRTLGRYSFSDSKKADILGWLPALQPEAVRILFALERYEMLMDSARYILPESLEHIKRLILLSCVEYEERDPKEYDQFLRPRRMLPTKVPESIDEALALGSKPAMVYKALAIALKTHRAQIVSKQSSSQKNKKAA